jgi:prepilin-type N-terminal cleavage/methylation domain-containing protein
LEGGYILFGFMRKLAGEKGFTLLEAMTSVVILSITATGVYSSIILANRFIVRSQHVTEATNIARMILEEIADDPAAADLQSPDTRLPNASWQVEYSDEYSSVISESQIPNTDPLIITVTVFWQESAGTPERSVQLSTKTTQGAM